MPKISNNSVLFQLGAVTQPLLPGAVLTNIRPLSAGKSVYDDRFTGVPRPALADVDAPQSILSRRPQSQEDASKIDWDELILSPKSPEEVIAAIQRAGELRDARAVEAIIAVQTDVTQWLPDVLHGSAYVRNFYDVANEAILSIGRKALHPLISILRKSVNFAQESLQARASHAIVHLNAGGIDCTEAIRPLVSRLRSHSSNIYVDDYINAMIIGGEEVIPEVMEIYRKKKFQHTDYTDEQISGFLFTCGLSGHVVNALMAGKAQLGDPDVIKLLSDPLHKSAYEILSRDSDTKRTILEGSAVLEMLADPQGWITINDPQLAHDALELVASKAKEKRGKLDNAIKVAMGVRIKDIEDEHYTYYADEILDAVVQFVKQSKLKNDPAVQELMAKVRYGDDIKLRYIRRDVSDTSLGSKCGDCTSKGSIHFGDSMTWFINPAYQIIKMSKGKRFIGKIHITLGSFGGEDAIIIDALEFNPQAQQGKPYYEDGVACFTEAMEFLKDLARRQNRQLIALTTSNSSGAVEMLEEWGEILAYDTFQADLDDEYVAIVLLMAHEQVRDLLRQHGYNGEIRLYYQMLVESAAFGAGGRDLLDDKSPILEREVINPAQIADENVAAAMRAREFELAATHIMANPTWNQQVKAIFGVPADMGISPAFLAKRLRVIYRDEALAIESLKKGFSVSPHSFRRIPTDLPT